MSIRWIRLQFSALLLGLLGACSSCYVCKPNCNDYLQVIPSGAFPPTNTYHIEIEFDDSHFECAGYFESEGEDHWTCSEGVEAHSRVGWETPTFYIWRDRDEVDEQEVHVKMWREDVLIFDDAILINWQEASTDYSVDPPCGCWAGIIRVSIENFEGLEG